MVIAVLAAIVASQAIIVSRLSPERLSKQEFALITLIDRHLPTDQPNYQALLFSTTEGYSHLENLPQPALCANSELPSMHWNRYRSRSIQQHYSTGASLRCLCHVRHTVRHHHDGVDRAACVADPTVSCTATLAYHRFDGWSFYLLGSDKSA